MDLDTPRFDDADGFYADLLQAHEGLSDADSALLNAKLVLLLANQLGQRAALRRLIDAARRDLVTAEAA